MRGLGRDKDLILGRGALFATLALLLGRGYMRNFLGPKTHFPRLPLWLQLAFSTYAVEIFQIPTTIPTFGLLLISPSVYGPFFSLKFDFVPSFGFWQDVLVSMYPHQNTSCNSLGIFWRSTGIFASCGYIGNFLAPKTHFPHFALWLQLAFSPYAVKTFQIPTTTPAFGLLFISPSVYDPITLLKLDFVPGFGF